ncbi:hypothetical protein BJ165DRAFT_1400775 [Panaeolus papilionaceus]|nr:hypothetical protein BJ165DRAFT_1400775 [Panaeolus papilionaceus]
MPLHIVPDDGAERGFTPGYIAGRLDGGCRLVIREKGMLERRVEEGENILSEKHYRRCEPPTTNTHPHLSRVVAIATWSTQLLNVHLVVVLVKHFYIVVLITVKVGYGWRKARLQVDGDEKGRWCRLGYRAIPTASTLAHNSSQDDRIVLTPHIPQTTTPDAAFQGLLLALGVADAAAGVIVIFWILSRVGIGLAVGEGVRMTSYGTQQDTTEIEEGDSKNDATSHQDVCWSLSATRVILGPYSCFRCSGAYVPSVNKGRRRSRLEQNNESLSTHNAFINRARGPSTIDGILKPNNSSAMPSYRPAPRGPSSLSKGFEAHTCAPPLPPKTSIPIPSLAPK